jgi:hypothetical protein
MATPVKATPKKRVVSFDEDPLADPLGAMAAPSAAGGSATTTTAPPPASAPVNPFDGPLFPRKKVTPTLHLH